MQVTIGICTWNKAGLLDRVLTGMGALAIPSGLEWEVLVVNNNSTDQTDAVISRHRGRLPIRRLFEPTPGKSNALNRAIQAVRGELILWTDDDVLVDRHWLAEYVAAAEAFPRDSFFGGPIEPVFDASPPVWLRRSWEHLRGAYGSLDLGTEPLRLEEDQLPYGANFAIRTRVQRCYLYDPSMCLRENERLGGEDILLCRQLLADGHRGRWVPKARVRHWVSARCLTIGYVRGCFFGAGRTTARTDRASVNPFRSSIWRRAQIFCRAAVREAKYRFFRLLNQPEHWAKHLARSSYHWGYLSGLSCHRPAPPKDTSEAQPGRKPSRRKAA